MDKIIHLTDLHFWQVVRNPLQLLNKRLLGNINVVMRRRREFIQDRAATFADAAMATGIETVLITGDLTSTATEAEFSLAGAFLAGLREKELKLILLPGNHDVYTYESARARRFERRLGDYAPPALPARVDLPGGAPLVLAPTVTPNLLSSRGRISPPEIARVADLAATAPPGPVLLAAHYPALERTAVFESGWNRRLRNAALLRRALGETGRDILYVAGHVHRFSYQRDPDYPKLTHLTSPALFLQRHGSPVLGGFSEIHAGPEGFTVFHHELTDVWRRAPVMPAE